MKKNLARVLFLAIMSFSLFINLSCSSGSSSDSFSVKVYLLNKPADESADWGMWWWYDYKSEGGDDIAVSEKKGSWPTGADSLSKSDDIGSYVEIDYDTTNPRLGLLFVNKKSGNQSSDIVVPLSKFKDTKTLYCLYDNMTGYYTDISETYGVIAAKISNSSATEITAKVYKVDSVSAENVFVYDCNGEQLTVSGAELSEDKSAAVITVSGGSLQKIPYTVKINNKTVTAVFDNDLIDKVYTYSGDDLGLTLDGTSASFKVWAPLATNVELLLYTDADSLSTAAKTEVMTQDKTSGVWSKSSVDVSNYKYYQYSITTNGTTSKVCDIYAKAASGDSVASQIINIDDSSVKPENWNSNYYNPWADKSETKSYTEAVIYEMHIRDWSKAFGENNTGKFEEITAALSDSGAFANHLKDLGITHVQILPMFDYAEKNSNSNYNWGYNPYHYNVPEGRYVNYGTEKDGTDAVIQMREMIQAFHDAGIAVNMDVVYNHTSGNGSGSLYDMTVPDYFYRQDDSGNNKNGSGCGNELATQRTMVRKYVIDSLKHWMNDYHINGFRFDLMGLHETETMKEIYDELSEIDPNVMVYGEPWASSGAIFGKTDIDKCSASEDVNGVACFNDDIRDAIKGSVFDAGGKGHVQGEFADSAIKTGLVGSLKKEKGFTSVLGRSINYVECHDNLTLFDKLAYSNFKKYKDLKETEIQAVSAQNKLAAAYLFLAQGTPFINGGQEFMRTKNGNHNSYNASDTINGIDLTFKDTYSDVYNTYKGLIALRKAKPSAFGANTDATAETVSEGVTKYTTGEFLVYFNATDNAVNISAPGYAKSVDVSSGTPTVGGVVSTVPAKSFVILKK